MNRTTMRLFLLNFRSMRFLMNNGSRRLIYAKNVPFVLSCSGVRSGNIIQKRFRGVVEGGNIQSLSESHCLQKGSEKKDGWPQQQNSLKNRSNSNFPLLRRHRALHSPLASFLYKGCLPSFPTGEPGNLQDPVQTTPI